MGAEGAVISTGNVVAGVMMILFVVQTLVVLSMFRFTREMIDNLYAMVEYQQEELESVRDRVREQARTINRLLATSDVSGDSVVTKEDSNVC